MTTLLIHRLGAEVATTPDDTSPRRVERLLRLVADQALEDQQATYGGLTGEWFVRRLDLDLDLAADEPDVTAATRWAARIADAIGSLVADGDNVCHFRTRGRLVADLIVGLASGDLSRSWVWRQAGLLAPTGPDPATQPAAALVNALSSERRVAVPALTHAIHLLGVRPLHAVLGPSGWAAVADVVRPGWRSDAGSTVPVGANSRGLPGVPPRAEAVLAASALATAVRSAPAPDPVTRAAWAVLILAEVDPTADPGLVRWVGAGLRCGAPQPSAREPHADRASDRQPNAARVAGLPLARPDGTGTPPRPIAREPLHSDPPTSERPIAEQASSGRPPASAIAAEVADPTGTPAGSRSAAVPIPGQRASMPTTTRDPRLRPRQATLTGRPASDPSASDRRRGSDQNLGAAEDSEAGAPTDWAGLLFLLNAAATAGMPEAIETDARLASRTLRWVLHSLALRLIPIRGEDPAALALAGLTSAMPVPCGPPSVPAEEEALDEQALHWATTVGQLLEQARSPLDDTPVPTLWSLARRPGRIVADPGWLEIQLSLADIDLVIRRAGLDLDPGWIPWLGTVVVFRYV